MASYCNFIAFCIFSIYAISIPLWMIDFGISWFRINFQNFMSWYELPFISDSVISYFYLKFCKSKFAYDRVVAVVSKFNILATVQDLKIL